MFQPITRLVSTATKAARANQPLYRYVIIHSAFRRHEKKVYYRIFFAMFYFEDYYIEC